MKHKRKDWSKVPWTPFIETEVDADDAKLHIIARFLNSRYQVSVFQDPPSPMFGEYVHLSFKTHDRQARHDWRDMQRIKNEICGPEFDAIEIFPAEAKLVDAANQYHLFVFKDFKLPIGFQVRLVADGDWRGSKQRPFALDERPSDCKNTRQYEAYFEELAKQQPQHPMVVALKAQLSINGKAQEE